MVQFAEVALKLTANVRDAVRSIETVDKAVERVDKRVRTVSEYTRNRLQRAGRGLAGGLAGGQDLTGIVQGALPVEGIAGLAASFVILAQQGLNRFFDQQLAKLAEKLQESASAPEAVANFVAAVRKEVEKESTETSPLVGLFRRVSGRNEFRAQARENFRDLARSDPALAGAILANLPPELEPIRGDLEAILNESRLRNTQREQFRKSLSQTEVTVVNQTTYSAFAGVGGESTVGREVRQVLDRRDRNNGRYVTPYSR